MAMGSYITREMMETLMENRGVNVAREIYDKLWTFFEAKNDGAIYINGFLEYMRSEIDKEYREGKNKVPVNLFKINPGVFATSILDYVRSALDRLSAEAVFDELYQGNF